MTAMLYAILAACVVLFVVPIVFVWNQVYEDGLFGRIGLIGISFSAFIFGARIIQLGRTHLWPETELMIVSFAVFLIWHLWRFHRRVLKAKSAEQGKLERRTHKPYHHKAEANGS